MQAIKNKIILKKNIVFLQKANFSQNWATNTTVGAAVPKHVDIQYGFRNAWSVFNKNATPIRSRVDHSVNQHAKIRDFPTNTTKLANLRGKN